MIVLEILPWGIEELGPKQLRFDNPGRFITSLLIVGATFQIGGGLAMIVSGRVFGLMPLLFGAALAYAAYHRTKTMGSFLVDGEKKIFAHEGAKPKTWSFDQVLSIETIRDNFAGTAMTIFKGQPRWVIIHLPEGRSFRLCKGHAEDLAPLLGFFRHIGLPVR
jgi:hypothetical protein